MQTWVVFALAVIKKVEGGTCVYTKMQSPNKIHRSYSDKYVSGMSEYDLFKNKNVDWISGPFTKACYIIFILLTWSTLHISTFFSSEDCWTVTNIIHGVVISYFLI
jgi:hypothetical protein